MAHRLSAFASLVCLLLSADQVTANGMTKAYFSNDSLNGLKLSDAYETHNMGLIYSNDEYYFKLDLGIVSPDMYVYRNEYREANRSFGELISVEIGDSLMSKNDVRLYARARAAGKFGADKLQAFVHRLLSLQPVNDVNELVRMPSDAWIGLGLRTKFRPSLIKKQKVELELDGFVGTDTSYINASLTKVFRRPQLAYDFTLGGRFIAYDQIISAPPINAQNRSFIPTVSFGISYDVGAYSFYVRDAFSLPSVASDSRIYGVLSMGASYNF